MCIILFVPVNEQIISFTTPLQSTKIHPDHPTGNSVPYEKIEQTPVFSTIGKRLRWCVDISWIT